MTHFEFKSDGKKGRNKYVGSWREKSSKAINLPFTVDSMRQVLKWGLKMESSPFNHQDIAHWCDQFHMSSFDDNTEHSLDIAIGIAGDVDVQWGCYLANSYSLEELKKLNFSEEKLPVEWFEDWLKRLNEEG